MVSAAKDPEIANLAWRLKKFEKSGRENYWLLPGFSFAITCSIGTVSVSNVGFKNDECGLLIT